MTRFNQRYGKSLPVLLACFFMLSALVTPYLAFADEGVTALGDSNVATESAAADASQGAVPDVSSGTDSSSRANWKNMLSGLSIKGVKPRIRPHFYADNSYNSNAALTRKDDDAWQARISPGITVDLPFNEKLYSSIDYTYSFATTQSRHSSTHTNTHNLDVIARYDMTSKSAVGVRNNSQWSELPGEPGSMFFLQTVNPQIKHQFGTKLSTGLEYVYQHFSDVTRHAPGGISDNFRGTISRDTFDDHGVKATADYKIGSALKVGPSFGWNARNFDLTNQKDYWQIQPALNATYEIGAKTKLGGYFGWAYRNFDVGSESELVYGVNATHLLGRKFVWDVSYDKTLKDTFDTNYVFRSNSSTATNLDNYDRHFRVIKNHRIGTSMTYNINEKNSAGIFAGFQFSKTDGSDNIYSGDRNNEKKMELGANYLYRLTRYVALQLAYTFGRQFEAKDNPSRSLYTFHKVTAGVNVAF